MERELLKGNTPGLILAVLESGDSHGYAIAREIERRSEGALPFKEGTLYSALHALENKGWIEANWDTSGSGPARKVYALTENGRGELKRRRSIWAKFSQAIEDVMRPQQGGEGA